MLPLAACGGAEEKAGFDPEITLQALADAGAFSEELEELDGDTAFTLYGLGNSGLEREDLTAAKVLRSAGATCEEGAVLVFTSGDQAQTAVQALGDYVQKQIDSTGTTVLRSCPSWRAPSSSSGRTLCCCWWPVTWRRLRACWSSKGR